MCGIFGAYWNKGTVTADTQTMRAVALTILAREMEGRGGQSYGLAIPLVNRVEKNIGSITGVSMMPYLADRVIYGHTRFATAGKVCKENAHPFRLSTLTGCHNGVVYNHTELSALYRRTDEVDSVHLLRHIEEGATLEDIESYGALVWHEHANPKTLFFGTWNGGEFAVARTSIGYLFASTKSAVQDAYVAAAIPGKLEFFQLTEGIKYALSGDGVREVKKNFFTCRKSVSKRTWRDGFASGGGGAYASTFSGNWYDEWVARDRKQSSANAPVSAPSRTLEIIEELPFSEDREQLEIIATTRGMTRNEAKRVWAKDFDPLDEDDEFYWSNMEFDEGLWMAVLDEIDVEEWAYTYGKGIILPPRAFVNEDDEDPFAYPYGSR